jgi:predicted nucleic-acid-binding Zn-ribbon protein
MGNSSGDDDEMTTTEQTHCLKCGSTTREYGQLTSVGGVAFSSGTTLLKEMFGTPQAIIAIACLKCGHIELILEKVPREYAERMEEKGTE